MYMFLEGTFIGRGAQKDVWRPKNLGASWQASSTIFLDHILSDLEIYQVGWANYAQSF